MNLPSDFTTYTRRLLGDELFARLADGLDSEQAPVSIRLNPFKAGNKDVPEAEADGIVPWCSPTGRYLKARPNFTFDPFLHAGLYYVQEAASMFIHHAVQTLVQTPVRMLDLCAAPGGKSTALRAALPTGSLLFSNEPMRTRAQILSENMQKFGHEDVIVTNNYPRDYRKACIIFDAILADVPCSGEGMFRKDDGARQEWSMQNVDNCWRLQREIISDIWPCLRPGGLLFYSTCTFNAHEDEENVEWIARELGADVIELPTQKEWNITPAIAGQSPAYRFLPGISRSEGLFMAVLRKHGSSDDKALSDTKNKKKKKQKSGKADKNNAKQKFNVADIPLLNAQDFCLKQHADDIIAIPKWWEETYDEAAQQLNIMHAGVCMGTLKGKDIIPNQSVALSRQLSKNAFPCVEVDYTNAIAYLRKEAVTLPPDTPRGFVLLNFEGIPIGFEKNIGSRANNIYPQEWRIKSSHAPSADCRPIVIK